MSWKEENKNVIGADLIAYTWSDGGWMNGEYKKRMHGGEELYIL